MIKNKDTQKVIAIYGVGLIGGSLGLALKHKGFHRVGIGRNKRKLAQALRRGAVDTFTTDIKEGVKDADIVVLCVPVELILPKLALVARYIKKDAVVTDVGSVKSCIMKTARRILPRRFIGSHPMAGSEKSGIRFAQPDLFKEAGCIIVPDRNPAWAIRRVTRLWKLVGARIMIKNAAAHDHLVAVCSHLPHVVAYAMMRYVMDVARKDPDINRMIAGSFRDMTRVAMSSPDLWSYISYCNAGRIKRAADSFHRHMKHIVSMMRFPASACRLFTRAAAQRKKIGLRLDRWEIDR